MPQPADNPESGAVQSPKSQARKAFPPFQGERAMARANGGQAPEGEDTLRKPPSDRTW